MRGRVRSLEIELAALKKRHEAFVTSTTKLIADISQAVRVEIDGDEILIVSGADLQDVRDAGVVKEQLEEALRIPVHVIGPGLMTLTFVDRPRPIALQVDVTADASGALAGLAQARAEASRLAGDDHEICTACGGLIAPDDHKAVAYRDGHAHADCVLDLPDEELHDG